MQVFKRFIAYVVSLVMVFTLAFGQLAYKTTIVNAEKTDTINDEMTAALLDQQEKVGDELPTGDVNAEEVVMTKEGKKAAEEVLISDMEEAPTVGDTLINSNGIGDNEYDTYGYDALSSGQKALYDDLDKAFAAYVKSDAYLNLDYTKDSAGYDSNSQSYLAFTLDKKISEYGITGPEAMKAYFTYRNNNPEYYWISTQYFQYDSANFKYSVIIDDYYAKSAALRQRTEAKIAAGVATYKSIAAKQTTTYAKVKAVHDRLVDEAEYAYTTPGNSSTGAAKAIWAHSVAGSFVARPNYPEKYEVVCEGYAKTFQLILQELGIANVYIVGLAKGGGHAWNAVKLEDGAYHYFDVTWDDKGDGNNDGREYLYYSAPKSFFENEHNAFSSSGNVIKGEWLYNLPSMSDDSAYTYYSKYNTYMNGVTEADVGSRLLQAIKTEEPSGTGYFHFLCKKGADLSIVTEELELSKYSYSNVDDDYAYCAFCTPKKDYGVTVPATDITLSKTEAELDCSKEMLPLEATITPNNFDDNLVWSATGPSKVTFTEQTGSKTTASFRKAGQYEICVTAMKSGLTKKCIVTVTNSDSSVVPHIYTDSTKATVVTDQDATLYAAGANKKDVNGQIIYNKFKNFYTDIAPTAYVDSKTKKTKKSKVLVGVSMTDTIPEITKKKVLKKDTDAAKIIGAARKKNGTLRVTAKSKTGTAYVWVVELQGNEVVDAGCLKVTVLQAPTKIQIVDTISGDAKLYKKGSANVGGKVNIYLNPIVSKTKTPVTTGTYTLTPAKGMDNYVSIKPISGDGYGYEITAKGLKNNKRTNVKINAVCNQNRVKATFTLSIFNHVTGVQSIKSDSSLLTISADGKVVNGDGTVGSYMAYPVTVSSSDAAATAVINVTPTLASGDFAMTDKPKVYAIGDEAAFALTAKGNFKVLTKATGPVGKIKASIKTTGNDSAITVKIPKNAFATGGTTCLLVVYDKSNVKLDETNYGFFVIPITVL